MDKLKMSHKSITIRIKDSYGVNYQKYTRKHAQSAESSFCCGRQSGLSFLENLITIGLRSLFL